MMKLFLASNHFPSLVIDEEDENLLMISLMLFTNDKKNVNNFCTKIF